MTTRAALLDDYPWHELGEATVVDVGCGPGDSGFDIIQHNPQFKWIFQDLGHAIKALEQVAASSNPPDKRLIRFGQRIPADLLPKVQSGDITLVEQDYFQDNVSRGNVWYLRGVV